MDAGAAQLLGQLLLVKDPRLQQLAAGALRNLAIPAQNKVRAQTCAMVRARSRIY